MKCVCPMGGDRVCPDNCTYWRGLPKEQRQPIVIDLAKQGRTQSQIAKELNISQNTVSLDLADIIDFDNVKGQGKDTRGRKKSTGRPKGSGSRPRAKQTDKSEDAIIALADTGKTSAQIAKEVGVEPRSVRHALERERIRREAQADPIIDPTTLSKTAQEKLDAALRQQKRQQELEFDALVRAESSRRMKEMSLPSYRAQWDRLIYLLEKRKGILSKTDFRKILHCLHPDSRKSLSDARLAEAFNLFEQLELVLVAESKPSGEAFDKPPPTTYEDWIKARAAGPIKRSTKKAMTR